MTLLVLLQHSPMSATVPTSSSKSPPMHLPEFANASRMGSRQGTRQQCGIREHILSCHQHLGQPPSPPKEERLALEVDDAQA